ncbi:MAG: hypothetical protein WC765_00485 [Phycisphaerae bacterium]|jgi:hypothetical protein
MASDTTEKGSKVFYELCYRQYEFEMKETDQIYQRVSFVLVFLSLLGTMIFKLGRIDIFKQIFIRVDIFLYYLFILVSVLLLASSVVFGILFILPRKGKYKTIASMNLWQKWRNDYDEYLKQSGDQSEKLDDALLHEITDKFAEAQTINAPINEKRRQYFYRCVLMAALAIIPVSLQALFYLLLRLQGI